MAAPVQCDDTGGAKRLHAPPSKVSSPAAGGRRSLPTGTHRADQVARANGETPVVGRKATPVRYGAGASREPNLDEPRLAIPLPSRPAPTSEDRCSLCQGMGWVRVAVPVGDPRFGQPQPCSCQRATRQQRLAAQAFHASNLTEQMQWLTFETFQPTAQTRTGYECARAFATEPLGWLFLRGGYGVGKTHLLAAITNALLGVDPGGVAEGVGGFGTGGGADNQEEPREPAAAMVGHWPGATREVGAMSPVRREPREPHPRAPTRPRSAEQSHDAGRRYPLYVVVPVWLDYIRAGFDAQGAGLSDSAIQRKQQAMAADVLLLDDVGAESETAWTQEQLYQVLNARYNTRAPTVIATNRLPQQLEPRIRSRLSDWRLVEECVLAGPDQRRFVPER